MARLESCDSKVCCAAAIAETGTVVLDGGPRSGRRLLTLVPDLHVCVVEAGDIHASVPDAIAAAVRALVGTAFTDADGSERRLMIEYAPLEKL